MQRFSRCTAEPGSMGDADSIMRPRISSAPRRKSGALRSIRGTQTHLRLLAARCVRGLPFMSLENQRAQGKPGARCTRGLACRVESTRVSHHRFTGTPGLPCAMVLTVSSALSSVTGLCCHRRPRRLARSLLLANLTPASGRQDHTASPSADKRVSSFGADLRPSHPAPNVRDDRETPLFWERDGDRCTSDLGLK